MLVVEARVDRISQIENVLVTLIRIVYADERVEYQRGKQPRYEHRSEVLLEHVGNLYRHFAVFVEDLDVFPAPVARQKVQAREIEQVPNAVGLVQEHAYFQKRERSHGVYEHGQCYVYTVHGVSRLNHEAQRRVYGEYHHDHNVHDVDQFIAVVIEYFRAVRIEYVIETVLLEQCQVDCRLVVMQQAHFFFYTNVSVYVI